MFNNENVLHSRRILYGTKLIKFLLLKKKTKCDGRKPQLPKEKKKLNTRKNQLYSNKVSL